MSQRIGFTLALIAVALLLYSALPSSRARATDNHPRTTSSSDQNLILFKRGALNTRERADLDVAQVDFRRAAVGASDLETAAQTRIVHFNGSIRSAWMERLKAGGIEVIGYLPNNAYIIRAPVRDLAAAADLYGGPQADATRPIQWIGRFEPLFKIDPAFTEEMLANGKSSVSVEIELLDRPESVTAIDYIKGVASSVNRAPRRFLKFIVLDVSVRVGELLTIAGFDEVIFAGRASDFRPNDERSAQIVAGNLTADWTQPVGPGYLLWLEGKGLASPADFLIDVTDTGLDRGSTLDTLVHPDFRDAEQRSRVGYNINYTKENPAEDRRGHGTLVASIATGLGMGDFRDAAGFTLGTGVDPFSKLGASRIFDSLGNPPFQLNFTNMASIAYSRGARVSNNSWGSRGADYDAAAQEYDSLVRDAEPLVPGNQEMVFVFSAGNSGPGGNIGSPGVAKNVITVAASENFRPEGSDSCNLDGEGPIGPEGANSALDILRFSSGGPTLDGRAKPDITAPGTHVYGAASQAPSFNGNGLCPGIPLFQPPGQHFYTWSSGTSIAAPHVSGAASLARRYFTTHNLLGDGRPPSPAMTKAFLINSATYMTGDYAGGDLPGERQGWGLVNLSRAFDDASRVLVDQTQLFIESGQKFEITGSIADRSRPLAVALVWTDAPGSLAGAAMVNDLDLEIKIGEQTLYRGNRFAGEFSMEGGDPDRLNNVECIVIAAELIPAGSAGNFAVTVRAANIAGDGVPGNGIELDQDFALVVYNRAEPLPTIPPKIVPMITAASYVKKILTITGRDFTERARVEINGTLIESAFQFDAPTNSLSIKAKRRKLKLNADADNQIVLIENGERSLPFVLRL
ncbi:MAG TPA: S8 family serine peptidase [Blastocatellia bacterium]|nr:S8 family serine peptidase [Blastocatellia bacterium]